MAWILAENRIVCVEYTDSRPQRAANKRGKRDNADSWICAAGQIRFLSEVATRWVVICLANGCSGWERTAEEDSEENVALCVGVGRGNSIFAPIITVVAKNDTSNHRRQSNYTKQPSTQETLEPKTLTGTKSTK